MSDFLHFDDLPEDMVGEIIRQSLSPVWLSVSKFTYKTCQKIIKETNESPIEAVRRGNLLMLPMVPFDPNCSDYPETVSDDFVFDIVLKDFYFEQIVLHFAHVFALRSMVMYAMANDLHWKELIEAVNIAHRYPLSRSSYKSFLWRRRKGVDLRLKFDDFCEKYKAEIKSRPKTSQKDPFMVSHYSSIDAVYAKNMKAMEYFEQFPNKYTISRKESLNVSIFGSWREGIIKYDAPEFEISFGGCDDLEIEKSVQDLTKNMYCLTCEQNAAVHFKDFKTVSKTCFECYQKFEAHPESKNLCFNCSRCKICTDIRTKKSKFCDRHSYCKCKICRGTFTRPIKYLGNSFKCKRGCEPPKVITDTWTFEGSWDSEDTLGTSWTTESYWGYPDTQDTNDAGISDPLSGW